MWNPKGELKFIDIGNGYYEVKFNDVNFYNNAL